MKNIIAETMFISAPQSTEITMKRREIRIIRMPIPFEDLFLQKNDAIMLTRGPPNMIAGPNEVSTSPFVAAEITPEQMEAHKVLGNDSTNAITPNTIGAAVLGFRITTSVDLFSLILLSLFAPLFLMRNLTGASFRSACRSRPDTNQDKKKASPRIPSEAVRIALEETQREASATRCLCKVSSSLKLLTFHSTTALQR
ncbi:MAG: hypothetical protein IKO55_11160 [Kiritimatiellae bacterium]|nr:hypothetical protein [Kiritimatiellia bacterium]